MPSTPNPTVSLCMIVKDEAAVLGRCLDSVPSCVHEIIIVDTGSADVTKEVAGRYTGKIYDFSWIDDFAAARNHSFGLAGGDYILWLDADDVLLPEDSAKLAALLGNLDPIYDAFSMIYNLGRSETGHIAAKLRRNRLVKRSCGFRWVGAVHEYLDVTGKILDTAIAVTHLATSGDEERNLRIYEQRRAAGECFTPRDIFHYAGELYEHCHYIDAAEQFQAFLATGQGSDEQRIWSLGRLADCYYHLGDTQAQLTFTLKTFELGIPRAENCCRLGYHFLQGGRIREAVFWYQLATQLKQPEDTQGLCYEDCWTWLPHIQLCVCYDRLEDYAAAHAHNEQAARYRPDDPRIRHNRRYLATRLSDPNAD